jgi:hypothetical protein
MIIGIEAAAPKCSVLPPQFALTLNGRLDVRESEVLGNCGSYQIQSNSWDLKYCLLLLSAFPCLYLVLLVLLASPASNADICISSRAPAPPCSLSPAKRAIGENESPACTRKEGP